MKKKMTYKQLEQKLLETEAQLIHVYHFASKAIEKTGTEHMIGSGIILQLTALGGRKIFEPIAIRDGFSKETIEAIKADIKRSYEQAIIFKP